MVADEFKICIPFVDKMGLMSNKNDDYCFYIKSMDIGCSSSSVVMSL